jgi:hypothetical protein
MTRNNLHHIAGNMGSRDNLPQYTLHNIMEYMKVRIIKQ